MDHQGPLKYVCQISKELDDSPAHHDESKLGTRRLLANIMVHGVSMRAMWRFHVAVRGVVRLPIPVIWAYSPTMP